MAYQCKKFTLLSMMPSPYIIMVMLLTNIHIAFHDAQPMQHYGDASDQRQVGQVDDHPL